MLVPEYEYRVYLGQKDNKELEKTLNDCGKYGWQYKDYKIESCKCTGTLILERVRMVKKEIKVKEYE